jgi:hypothetical protein
MISSPQKHNEQFLRGSRRSVGAIEMFAPTRCLARLRWGHFMDTIARLVGGGAGVCLRGSDDSVQNGSAPRGGISRVGRRLRQGWDSPIRYPSVRFSKSSANQNPPDCKTTSADPHNRPDVTPRRMSLAPAHLCPPSAAGLLSVYLVRTMTLSRAYTNARNIAAHAHAEPP